MNSFDRVRRHCGRSLAVGIVLFCCAWVSPVSGQIPPGYYDSATGLSGAALRNALHNIIDDHVVIPYSAVSFDARDALEILDEDPNNANNVVLIYSMLSVAKSTWPDWNREHLWPVSLGSEMGTTAYSDLHNLRACDADVNSLRSNRYFTDCEVDCTPLIEAPEAFRNFTQWEPPDAMKGDIARAIFYMDLRYNGDNPADEPTTSLEVQNVDSSTGCSCIGYLDTLVGWHLLDPVSTEEMDRNDGVYALQDNRNPFVDHPEYVGELWELPQLDGEPWINEFHYDNLGADVNEGVEIAGVAGTSLLGWTIVAYNGNGFVAYDSLPITGTIDDEGAGYGALWFPLEGLQNGSPDGIALVAPDDTVHDFISYEGTIDAVDGPAVGLQSFDPGVFEAGAPVGESLQLTGVGSDGPDFTWNAPSAHSRGSLNVGQTLLGSGPQFIRGDCNADAGYNIADAVRILDVLFGGQPAPCEIACDANNDGAINIADAVFLLSSLFSGGPLPDAPHPNCGPDGGSGTLSCDAFAACP